MGVNDDVDIIANFLQIKIIYLIMERNEIKYKPRCPAGFF